MITFPEKVLVDLKQHLEADLTRVTQQITDLTEQDPFSQVDRLNDNAASDTEANEEIDHERVQALIGELTKKRDDIQSALARISQGGYGLCVRCKKLIDTDRLALMPTATLCMDCQSQK